MNRPKSASPVGANAAHIRARVFDNPFACLPPSPTLCLEYPHDPNRGPGRPADPRRNRGGG